MKLTWPVLLLALGLVPSSPAQEPGRLRAVVTQLVQAGADGAPRALVYPGFPKDRFPAPSPGHVPWSPTDSQFLTVRIP